MMTPARARWEGHHLSRVLDYAWSRPSVAGLRAAGVIAVCRYLAYPGPSTDGKRLSPTEAAVLTGGGIGIVSNWEQSGTWAEYSGGFSTGASHATEAARQHLQCGGPASRPIYFSADFDATIAQLPTIANYYRGVASVIGLDRTGAYGSYRTIRYLLDQGVIRFGWQTYAWSSGQWDPRAQLRQIQNDVVLAGVACDINESIAADFGQWGVGGIDVSNLYSADNADAHGYALTQRLKQYQVHASGTDPGLTTIASPLAALFLKLEQFLNNPPVVALTDAQVTAMANQIATALNPQLAAIKAEVHQLRTALRAAAQAQAAGLADQP
jgi:hypothetical protein